jgi:NADH-quinone oxidoreductase subunit L
MTFFGPAKWQEAAHEDDHHAAADAHHGEHDDHHIDPKESPNVMLIPLYVLAFGAIFAGFIFKGSFIGEHASKFWKHALYYAPGNHVLQRMEDIPHLLALMPSVLMIVGFIVALYAYIWSPGAAARWAERNPLLYRFLLNKWYFDEIYDFLIVRPTFWLGRLLWHGGDQNIIDRFGPDGVAARVIDVTRNVVRLQSGYLYHYAFVMLIGVAAFITYYLVLGLH